MYLSSNITNTSDSRKINFSLVKLKDVFENALSPSLIIIVSIFISSSQSFLLDLQIEPIQFLIYKITLNNFQQQMQQGQTDKEDLLLNWINAEFLQNPGYHPIYEFEQLRHNTFLPQLLIQIHPKYFDQLSSTFDFFSIFKHIESYLEEIQGKKLRKVYRKKIIEQELISELVKLALFLLIQSPQKGNFIQNICELDIKTQQYLMNELKQIESHLQNSMQVKQILETVEKLELENEFLKEKFKQQSNRSLALAQASKQKEYQNKKIESEINKHNQQKKIIFEQLKINDLGEYLEVYRHLKEENMEMTIHIDYIESKKDQLQDQNNKLKKRINGDNQLIGSLNEQVQKTRELYMSSKEEVMSMSLILNQTPSDEPSILRQNKNFGNISKVQQSLQTNCSVKSSIILNFDESQEEVIYIKKYNQSLIEKLQTAYKQMQQMGQEVNHLKQDKTKLTKKNKNLSQKLNCVKQQHLRFMKDLKSVGL